jgi:hypothetical protein
LLAAGCAARTFGAPTEIAPALLKAVNAIREGAESLGRLVGRRVVEHDVNAERLLDAAVDLLQERDELLGAMARLAIARHTHGFDLPVRRMMALVPRPSAVASTISARQTALALLLRSAMIASSLSRFAGLT